MAEEPSIPEVVSDLRERGRRCVYGHLCPMVLHETNNVLTVMAGVRQLLRQGRTLSDRIGPMIDSQLEKMDRLVGWIHGMGEDDTAAGGPRTLTTVAENLEQLLSLAAKGRRTRFQFEGAGDPIQGTQVEVLSLGSLCALLPLLPPRSPGSAVEIDLKLGGVPTGVRLEALLSPCIVDPMEQADVRLAASLVRSRGGTFSCQRTEDGAARVEMEVPAIG